MQRTALLGALPSQIEDFLVLYKGCNPPGRAESQREAQRSVAGIE